MLIQVALYARVSSEHQAQANTIESQITSLQEKIKADGLTVLKEHQFLDDGYSGSTLMRPGLERLRDAAANHLLHRIYIHSPDRLARKYAYQFLLIEEFNRLGIEVIFLNNQFGSNPESDLLLQVQGIISEYERTKIMERSRRGKIHAAKKGLVSALSTAPYGYKYIPKRDSGYGSFEINEAEAEVVRLLFSWIGYERISLNAATLRLTKMGFPTPKGTNSRWSRSSVHCILTKTSYMGMAAFGKTKSVPKKLRLRPIKGHAQSKKYSSYETVSKDKWIFIPVPEIIEQNLFEIVQEQLEENKRRKREKMTGACYLLQGLVVCQSCGYGYYHCRNSKRNMARYSYYVCGGRSKIPGRGHACDNKSIRQEILEEVVWKEIKVLLNNPFYLEKEYQRRIKELKTKTNNDEQSKLKIEKLKLEKSIARLIDSYTEGMIEKMEFEPRIKTFKRRLSYVEQQIMKFLDNHSQMSELTLILGRIEEFSARVKQKLEDDNWQIKRDIVKALIKHIEIAQNEVNIIFRVEPCPGATDNVFLQDCPRRICTQPFGAERCC